MNASGSPLGMIIFAEKGQFMNAETATFILRNVSCIFIGQFYGGKCAVVGNFGGGIAFLVEFELKFEQKLYERFVIIWMLL